MTSWGFTGSGNRVLEFPASSDSEVAPAGRARLRYNPVSGVLEKSVSGSAYTPISAGGTGGGWTDDGTGVRLTTVTDTVAVGAAAVLGTEKLRVVGDVGIQGDIAFETGATRTVSVLQAASETAGETLDVIGGAGGDTTGASTGGAGGFASLVGGAGGDGDGAQLPGPGGTVRVVGGAAGDDGAAGGTSGGYVGIFGGRSSGDATGPSVTVQGGGVDTAGNANGGAVDVTGGDGEGTGQGGRVAVYGGFGNGSGNGGAVQIEGGAANGAGDGADVRLRGGFGTTNGDIVIGDTQTSVVSIGGATVQVVAVGTDVSIGSPSVPTDVTITIKDNDTPFTIKEGTNEYVNIDTTDGAELLVLGNATVAALHTVLLGNKISLGSGANPSQIAIDAPGNDASALSVLGGGSSYIDLDTTTGSEVIEINGGPSGDVHVGTTATGIVQIASPTTLLGFFGTAGIGRPTVNGALSSVTDAAAKAVLTSIIAALASAAGLGLFVDGTS